MKKREILNACLSQALVQARRGGAILILNAGMPIPNGCEVIDFALARGLPSFLMDRRVEKFDLCFDKVRDEP